MCKCVVLARVRKLFFRDKAGIVLNLFLDFKQIWG